MTEKELLAKIDGNSGADIFALLYGEKEVNAARQRYRALIETMSADSGFPAAELGLPEEGRADTREGLRVFSAPGRTELGGNHTDHNRGKVLAASIQLDSVALYESGKTGPCSSALQVTLT